MIWRCGETVGSHCSDRSQRSGDGLCGVHNGLWLLLRLRRRLLRRRPLQAWRGRERCAGAHVQLVAELQYLAHGLHTHMHTSMVLARYVSTYACTCYTYTHAYVHVHPCVCACASHVHVHVHVHAHPCMCMCMCIACMCMCMCMCGLQRAQQPQRRRVVDVMHGGDGGEHCVLAVCAVGDVREHRVAHRPPPLVGQQHRLRRAGRRRARRRPAPRRASRAAAPAWRRRRPRPRRRASSCSAPATPHTRAQGAGRLRTSTSRSAAAPTPLKAKTCREAGAAVRGGGVRPLPWAHLLCPWP